MLLLFEQKVTAFTLEKTHSKNVQLHENCFSTLRTYLVFLLFPLTAIPPVNHWLICIAHWGWGRGCRGPYTEPDLGSLRNGAGMWKSLRFLGHQGAGEGTFSPSWPALGSTCRQPGTEPGLAHALFITVRWQVGKGDKTRPVSSPHFFQISMCQIFKTLQIQILKFH